MRICLQCMNLSVCMMLQVELLKYVLLLYLRVLKVIKKVTLMRQTLQPVSAVVK